MKKKQWLKGVWKNKRGMITVEHVISLLIFVTLFSFTYDLTLIVVQRNRASNILQDMARIVQVQGGVERTTPAYFPKVGDSYLRTETFIKNSKTLFSQVGIDPETVEVRLIGTSVTGDPIDVVLSSSSDVQLKYKTPFTLEVSYRYTFSIWSHFAPGLEDCSQTLASVGFTEYKQNFDEWDGE